MTTQVCTTYETRVVARCPADEAVVDIYELTVTKTTGMVPVERILAALADFVLTPVYQEDLTREIAERLGEHVTVRTVGLHSGVSTVCVARSG